RRTQACTTASSSRSRRLAWVRLPVVDRSVLRETSARSVSPFSERLLVHPSVVTANTSTTRPAQGSQGGLSVHFRWPPRRLLLPGRASTTECLVRSLLT